jgi:MoaA/NifB/PqqE/SkfB family radical SAM enzyme
MNKYCAMPFNHVNVGTNGDYQVCCIHSVPKEHRQNINSVSVSQWLKNPYLLEVQSALANDKPHAGCYSCWQQESAGTQSLRQAQAKEYQIIGARPGQSKILSVECALGNLCNLSCVMCDEQNSSAILSENRQLGIAMVNQRDFTWSDAGYANLQEIFDYHPRVINLRGGEPLYNKRILQLIEQFPESTVRSTMLHLTTNATTWDQQWQQALSRFRSVRMMLSIDAVDELAEYIRYPSKFNQIQHNIQQIATCKNIRLVINATVQNLNILYIDQLIDWAKTINITLMLNSLVKPAHLQITNLPVALKLQAIEVLDGLCERTLEPHILNEILAYRRNLRQSLSQPFDQDLWQRFVDYISIRDNLRGNSHRKFLQY